MSSTSTTTTSTAKNLIESDGSIGTTAMAPHLIFLIIQLGDFIVRLYNTTADGSMDGLNGIYSVPNEVPPKAIDDSSSTKYLNYGNDVSASTTVYQLGINTGFYVTSNISIVSITCGLLFTTANEFPERDLLAVTLEGTKSTALNSSSSWTLIHNESTGIDLLSIPCRNYRLLITLQRSNSNSVQYAESQIWGYY